MEMSSMTNLRELFSAGGPVLILLLLFIFFLYIYNLYINICCINHKIYHIIKSQK